MTTAESSTLRQPLPERYVAKIFAEMQGNYGSRFLNMWKTGQIIEEGEHAGKDAGIVNAMANWGKKLAGFIDQTECIRYVLDRLPADPPSLPKFIELCRSSPQKDQPALAHKLTQEDHQRMAEAARAAKRAVERADMDKVEFWATHPRSHQHLRFITDAAVNDPAFKRHVETMVEAGICTPEGHALKFYRGGAWETVRRAA